MQFIRKHIYLTEVLLWIGGVGLMASMDPGVGHLFSFCPFNWLFDALCPGCGLGHAIAYLFRGEVEASWNAHPLAIPALGILLWRCLQVTRWHLKQITFKPTL